MALRFAMSGGNFIFSFGPTVQGVWATASGVSIVSNAPLGRVDQYAFQAGTLALTTPNVGSFTTLIAGFAVYLNAFSAPNSQLIIFEDSSTNNQCDLRVNGTGQLIFSRNGTIIGGSSTLALSINTWNYIEFKAILSTSGGGTCEARVNGVVVLTSTGLTNATTVNTAAAVKFAGGGGGGAFARDFYVVDTASGANTNYLGDISVIESFPNGPGVNSAWAPNVGPFTLTSVNGTGVYQGTITGGAANAYVGYNFNITGFVNGGNNLTGAACTASTATSLTFAATTTIETHAGSAAFQAIVQEGINKTGTRPNGDVTYNISNVAGQVIDYAHQNITLSGIILGVIHETYARKDDLGTRIFVQTCLSGASTEVSSNISPGNTYQYWQDILEVDPSTNTQWGVTGFNNATFGVKFIA